VTRWRIAATAFVALLPSMAAAQNVQLYAAGSLRGALTDVAQPYRAATGRTVTPKFGPSGLLKDEIAGGAKADVFASANMEHPQALAAAGKSGPVVMFARNRLCALVRPSITTASDTILEKMLDPQIKLGTSTPKADPSGDYAWDVFRKADAVKAGNFAVLEKKALQLTGGPNSPAPPASRSVYGAILLEGTADIFLTYCTNAIVAARENPGQQVVALPEALAVGADYGLTVIKEAGPDAQAFADYILSPDGQRVLAKHGFAAPSK
jgi:ABC-type molybdate transport system substrate-binding protein